MIIKGKYDWYDPQSGLSDQAKSVFNVLPNLKELPHVPTYVMELHALPEKEGTTSKQLASVVKKAPLLASKLLIIANQMRQNTGSRIDSLEHAISYIGLTSFKDMILLAVVHTWEVPCKIFSRDRFWDSAFTTGDLSEILAKKFAPHLIQDAAYLAGTLANIGKITQAMMDPGLADRIASDLENVKILGTWTEGEGRHHGYSHTILGEIAASFWGFPIYAIEAIANHHSIPQSMFDEKFTMTEIVALANQLTHWVELNPHRIDETLMSALLERFKATQPEMEQLVADYLSQSKKSA